MSGYQQQLQDDVVTIMNYEEVRLEHNDEYGQENVMELINKKYVELNADQKKTKDKISYQLLMEALKGLIAIACATSFAGDPQITKLATQTILIVIKFLFTLRKLKSTTDFLKKQMKLDRELKEVDQSHIQQLKEQGKIFKASAMELIESARQLWSLKGQLANANNEDVRKFNKFTTQFAICVQMIVVKIDECEARLGKIRKANEDYVGSILRKLIKFFILAIVLLLLLISDTIVAALYEPKFAYSVLVLLPTLAAALYLILTQRRIYFGVQFKYDKFNRIVTANCESMKKHVSLMKESIAPVVNIPITRY